MTDATNPAALAEALDVAWESCAPIEPLSEEAGLTSVAAAYAIQAEWTRRRLAAGETIVGRKIGLTSQAVQEQMGVNEPDYGTLWGSRWIQTERNRGEVAARTFIAPKVEGEIAFLLGDPPTGENVTAADVLAATEATAASIEIVDSRIADWRIKLVDTIADNASYGAFVLGEWTPIDPARPLPELTMTMSKNGEVVAEGTGAGALGDPAHSVAWLLNKLRSFGVEVQAGDIVLSGALAATAPAAKGDVFHMDLEGESRLELAFT